MLEPEIQHFYGGNESALTCIKAVFDKAARIRISTAYFEPSGYQCLQDVLAGKELFLLIGREQGGTDRLVDVINEFVNGLSVGSLTGRTRAMRQMLDALNRRMLLVGVGDDPIDNTTYLDGRYLYQHAKLYFADENVVVVTSANMSEHGLVKSREAGYTVTEPAHVEFYLERFDNYFNRAKSITDRFIEELSKYLGEYDPFIIYSRALVELYDLDEADIPPQLKPLADYQRPAVTRVKTNIEEHGGALFIASTGLGKTVMAAHIAAYLRKLELIDNVIVVCPAGLREVWNKAMRAAKTSSIEFSYHTLSGNNPKRDSGLLRWEYEFKHVTEKTLVILDESHHVRNDKGGERLRNSRVSEAVRQKSAKLLMMTATPISRGINDVNNQLKLLPKPTKKQATELPLLVASETWKVHDSQSLSDLPPCFVLTTPTVVKHFSYEDEDGERYVLFSENDRRYFPRRLGIRTIRYENPLDNFLIDLLKSKLLYVQSKQSDSGQLSFADWDDLEILGERMALTESQLVHQLCSSPAKIMDFCKKVHQGQFNQDFAHPPELRKFIGKYEPDINHYLDARNDPKARALFEIIDTYKDNKIVIFCIYHETAQALAKQIKDVFPAIEVETTVGDVDKIDSLIKRFAPIANEVPEEERDKPLQILIATGKLSEGFNLQDAAILINYDLTWTVLQLAQRMGRLLRPWHEPREITIFNFVPSTMSNQSIHIALNWQKRLMNYNEQHRSFVDIPVLLGGGKQTEDLEMVELARGLQAFDNVSLDLDEVMQFIQQSDQLQTTSFYDDLAVISIEDKEYLHSLPPGIRSARVVKGNRELFVLFRYRRKTYPALFDKNGKIRIGSENPDAIMKKIRCEKYETRAPFTIYPEDDEFDEWIEQSKLNWAKSRNIVEISQIQIVCAMALIPPTS